jgi:hypothetical protein
MEINKFASDDQENYNKECQPVRCRNRSSRLDQKAG